MTKKLDTTGATCAGCGVSIEHKPAGTRYCDTRCKGRHAYRLRTRFRPLARAILTRPWHPRHVRHCCFCAAPLATSTPQGGALALVCASAACQAERRREVDRRHNERHRDRRREHWRALRRRESADPVTAERNRRRSREHKRRLAGMTPERAAELDRRREASA